MSNDLRRKFLYSLVIALLVYIGLALYSDWGELTSALQTFPWMWLAPVITLTLVNYIGRCLRWHWYLRLLGSSISFRDSVRTFGVGMLMVMTPGKAGEFLKPYMVRTSRTCRLERASMRPSACSCDRVRDTVWMVRPRWSAMSWRVIGRSISASAPMRSA